MKSSQLWIQFGLKLLSLIEAVLPALLVTLNHRLRGTITRLENEVAVLKYEKLKVIEMQRIKDKHATQSDHDTIDSFLDNSNTGQ